MIIVSGCPRSGTSLMMNLLRIALGDDRIMGSKFPMIDRANKLSEKQDSETDNEYEARQYMLSKMNPDKEEDLKKSVDSIYSKLHVGLYNIL